MWTLTIERRFPEAVREELARRGHLVKTAGDLDGPCSVEIIRRDAATGMLLAGSAWFQTGRFDRWTVAIAEVGPGNARAATVAVRAFTHFKPEIAAFVGVAGGVKDVGLGDVVVATKVYGYESGKETPDGFRVRPDVQTSHHELEQRARVLRTDANWCRRLDTSLWPDHKPTVHVGPIAAGEAVVADNAGRIATQLRLHYGDVLAVEMEGRGFLEAAHIDSGCHAVVVRGISDLLTGKAEADTLGWQRRAADAAASFFFEMLALQSGPQPDRVLTDDIHPSSAQPNLDAERRFALGRVRQFHNERVKQIAGSTPQVPVLAGALLVMHLVPLDTIEIPQPVAFTELSRNPHRFPPIVDTAPRYWKINFDGLLTGSNNDGLGKPQRAYVYVFRSGIVEAVVSNIARGHNNDALQLPNIESMIIHYARVYGTSIQEFGIRPPLAVW